MWIPVSPLVVLTIHLVVPADETPRMMIAQAEAPKAEAPKPAPAPEASKPQSNDAKLEGVIDGIQKVYDTTTEFSAQFTQKYTYTLLRRTQESTGEVKFKKPGKMRWDYKTPQPKSFIVDGKAMWLYQPTDHNAFVNACFQQNSDLVAPIAFMWGQGKLREQFVVNWFQGTFGDKTDHHLELAPKTPSPVFAKLILVVDPNTFRVKQSIVVDPSGNVNQFIFTNVKYKGAAVDKDFNFTPPQGTHTTRMPGTCNDPVPGLN